jgi:nucleotide-binding universal stress UspA family protein
VMSRSGYSRISDAQAKLDAVVPQVVRNCIRPVLVAAKKPREGKDVQNILVAYDGSMHSGRALLVAAELGARPGVQCTLVAIAATEESGAAILAPAESFLYHHGITPRKQVVIGSKPSDLICGIVTSTQTDILIMGAYGHSPVREMLFGSTTERVLFHCGTTVILQS